MWMSPDLNLGREEKEKKLTVMFFNFLKNIVNPSNSAFMYLHNPASTGISSSFLIFFFTCFTLIAPSLLLTSPNFCHITFYFCNFACDNPLISPLFLLYRKNHEPRFPLYLKHFSFEKNWLRVPSNPTIFKMEFLTLFLCSTSHFVSHFQ